MYYADKKDSLCDLFGTDDVQVEAGHLVANGRRYPIVDDVVILLDPPQYPEWLRRRVALAEPGEKPPDFPSDIQFTFGREWEQFPEILPEHEKEFAKYFDLVDLAEARDWRVCDLGCGIGRWSHFLRDRCRELVLVDFSDAIFVARRNLAAAPNALFFMGDLKRLPFRADFADLVFSLGVLHHLPTSALDEVRRLRIFGPRLLVYLYYALDNRPRHFRLLLSLVTGVRRITAGVQSARARLAFSRAAAYAIYLPLIRLGAALQPVGLAHHIPLADAYRGMSMERITQDVYDRFFTRIEQRVSRREILGLRDSFSRVTVSDGLPYWHFLCIR